MEVSLSTKPRMHLFFDPTTLLLGHSPTDIITHSQNKVCSKIIVGLFVKVKHIENNLRGLVKSPMIHPLEGIRCSCKNK